MKTVFVDTNVFIRYLVNDVPAQADKADELFDRAEKGQVRLMTGPPVFFEMAWTLKSFYHLDRGRIYECLSAVLGLPGLEISDQEVLEDALELFKRTRMDFADAYIVALSQWLGVDSIATFNKRHFEGIDLPLYGFGA